MEAVLGAGVAREKDKAGDVFVGEHRLARGGEKHVQSPYHVVGMLAPTGTVINRLALTDIASVWKVHEKENAEHDAALAAETSASDAPPGTYPAVGQEVTAVLVHYRSAMGALMLPRLFKNVPNAQTAVPTLEMARLARCLVPAPTSCERSVSACWRRQRWVSSAR